MRIVITGGFGRLGSAVTAQAIARGDQVVAVDRMIPAEVPAGVEAVTLDTSDYAGVRAVVDGADAVIHLAAYLSPSAAPWERVYGENTLGSYHALLAAADAGVSRVCLASSINAIGGVYSIKPRYDYFPIDIDHPCYAEDPYSLSKWVLEEQARSIARRFPALSIAALRFHAISDRDRLMVSSNSDSAASARDLWGYSPLSASAAVCLATLSADLDGAETFYCVAAETTSATPTAELLDRHYPTVPRRAPLSGNTSLYDSTPARERLGWPA